MEAVNLSSQTSVPVVGARGNNEPVLQKYGYIVGNIVGTGTYAKVKVAFSQKRQHDVALKIIRKKDSTKLFLDHFLSREIDLVKGLRHKHIIQYYQCIQTNHRVIIAMEYAESGTLLGLLTTKIRLTEIEARHYFRQLIDALEYCHSKGIAHRDLKLENLLLDRNNCLKLSDFGFARRIVASENAVALLSSTFCGTNTYASPEILKHSPYDPMQSDVWASGIVLYSLVIGRMPFEDTGSIGQQLKLVEIGPKFPVDLVISTICKDLLMKLIAPLEHRLQTAQIAHELWMNVSEATK